MSKKFDEILHFNGSCDQVLEMLQSASFIETLLKDAIQCSFNVKTDGKELTIDMTATYDLKERGVDKAIRVVLGDKLPLKIQNKWERTIEPPQSGLMEIEFPSLSAWGKITCTLKSISDEISELQFAGSVKSKKTLVAGKIEDRASKHISKLFRKIEKDGNDWLLHKQ